MTSKNMHKGAKHLVKGLMIGWIDHEPLNFSDRTIPGEISHANPVLRHMAAKIFTSSGDWIVNRARLKWRVTATIVFLYDKVEQHEEREFNFHGQLSTMNDIFCEEIKIAMNYGENYQHTKVLVECIGI